MCGIVGVFNFEDSNSVDPFRIKKMTDSLSHRGPDGEGQYVKANVGLGHRRLSLIDISTGTQPMYSDDGDLILVFNGEIYNYIELRQELQALGHRFKTSSDTEVIIKSYKQWGLGCHERFNGMWAFALWDNKDQQLLLSRDRIGEKPLYYSISNNSIVFGSEIKGLFAYGVPRNCNFEMLEVYLSLSFIPAPFTFFGNVQCLEPGHFLIVRKDKIHKHKYWDLPELDEANMLVSKKEVYETFEDLFHDSIKVRMRCEVPFGAFLSGGLDSSSIVAIMSKYSSYPVETFTIGFENKLYDERELAKQVADKFSSNHHEYLVNPDSFESSLKSISYHYDDPFGDSSAIPTGYVSKFAASKVKMVLTGDGGDELLSGYPTYQHEMFASLYKKLPFFLRRNFPLALSKIPRYSEGSFSYKLNRAQVVSYSANMDYQSRFLFKDTSIDLTLIKQITSNLKVYSIEEYLNGFMGSCTYKDSFYQLMYLNLKLTLPNDMLVKVDRMSMAYSLETRAPFLDYRLIEFMVNVDKKVKMHHFERKSILRNTIAKQLPPELLKAKKKGFAVPLHKWFKMEEFRDSLDKLKTSMPFLNSTAIEKVIQSNNEGKNYGNFIWMLFVLEKVLNKNDND